MSETRRRETREEIVRDMREGAAVFAEKGDRVFADTLAGFAKRMEGMETQGGNAAAMREALEALVQYWQWGGYDAAREAELKQRAMDALAIPPRNCDLIADEDDAWMEFVDSLDEGDAVTAKKALRWLYKEAEDAKEPVEI